jgi:hypothetical protein
MNPYYNQNYTREEIEKILEKIKSSILDGKYLISLNDNRSENLTFLETYNISKELEKALLLQIQIDDFCHSLRNRKIGFENELLYVFVPQVKLYNEQGVLEKVDVYTKFNLIELRSGTRVVVISIHKRNKPIEYVFRKQ